MSRGKRATAPTEAEQKAPAVQFYNDPPQVQQGLVVTRWVHHQANPQQVGQSDPPQVGQDDPPQVAPSPTPGNHY